MFRSLMKLIFNIIFLIIAVVVIYIIALMFNLVPTAYTPPVLFKDQYASFKNWLARDAAANDSTSGMSKSVNDYLNDMEKSNKEQPAATETTPQAPASTTTPPGPAGATTAPGTAPAAPAGTNPPEQKDAVTRAKEAAQQYQNSVNQEKQKLDNL